MSISIIVGGQYGSEGKGKVAHYFAREKKDTGFVVRCGGPNSGHTVIDEHGKARIFQQLPASCILPDVKLAICSGSYIDLDILISEIEQTNLSQERIFIDPDAVIITEELKTRETQSGIIERIGSTGSGTGAAVAARVNRDESLVHAKDIAKLDSFIADTPAIFRNALDHDERIIIEGTQGFGLSPIHSRLYPYTTSRDTTAATFLAEAGLSPLDVDEVILVIRAFPIRVAGNSGPLSHEIDWRTITNESGYNRQIEEKTTVTKNIRRVARFDPGIVRKAIDVNRPTAIVMNHLDYVGDSDSRNQSQSVEKFISEVESSINNGIHFLGFGPASMEKRET